MGVVLGSGGSCSGNHDDGDPLGDWVYFKNDYMQECGFVHSAFSFAHESMLTQK
jgi:hypothetical protein